MVSWAGDLWSRNGDEALLNTVVIATARRSSWPALGAAFLIPLGSRALARGEPFGLLGTSSRAVRAFWETIGFLTRGVFVLARAVPEYIYAFLLVGLLGPSAWPLVFALALHNVGILGRLWGEVMENQRPEGPRQWLRSGATRMQTYVGGLARVSFNRFLLFFFYRWETCIREATILGMLGISSLGYYISISHNWLKLRPDAVLRDPGSGGGLCGGPALGLGASAPAGKRIRVKLGSAHRHRPGDPPRLSICVDGPVGVLGDEGIAVRGRPTAGRADRPRCPHSRGPRRRFGESGTA